MATGYRFGRFELRPALRQLLVEGQPAALGARAFDVLFALIERRDRLVSKDELLEVVWAGLVVEENNLQVQVSALRKILGEGVIETVPGRGYRFVPDVAAAPYGSSGTCNQNLPQPLTRFIGHEADLDQYEKIVAKHRLVTLTGAGGAGKTRLAVQLASRLLPHFPDGVWFVDLAPMADAERLPLAVAKTLGLADEPNRSIIDTLCEHAAAREMLVVLDNCEHLLGASATLVTTLLTRAARLNILATSREALGLPGEQTLRVRSLSCPPSDQRHEFQHFADFEAVQLFVDRARLVQPAFALDRHTALLVGEICRRLDGIPLAIELAAARANVCSVGEIAKMLDDRFKLLTSGSRIAPRRHQTLLATMKWSFDLLTPAERRLLERLSVFSGGWTLEGAIGVAGDNESPFEMLECLSHLVDKSLVATHMHERNATRYSMLETVRQYGQQALEVADEKNVAVKRHLEYFVAMAERLEPAFTVRKEGESVDALAPELENIVQALRDCERIPGGADLALRLVATLHEYWVSLGLLELGYRLTIEALARPGATHACSARAKALFGATRCARFLDKNDEARDHATACLALARLLRDEHLEVAASAYLGIIAVDAGDLVQGIALCEETLRLARERAYVDQICRLLNMIGWAQLTLGELQLAASSFEESLLICREWGDGNAIAMVACNLIYVDVLRGRLLAASHLGLEALDVSASAKSRWTSYNVLVTVATIAVAAHEPFAAARLLGATQAVQGSLGLKRQEGGFVDGLATVVGNAISEPDFGTCYDAGHALMLEQAIEDARAWLEDYVAANAR